MLQNSKKEQQNIGTISRGKSRSRSRRRSRRRWRGIIWAWRSRRRKKKIMLMVMLLVIENLEKIELRWWWWSMMVLWSYMWASQFPVLHGVFLGLRFRVVASRSPAPSRRAHRTFQSPMCFLNSSFLEGALLMMRMQHKTMIVALMKQKQNLMMMIKNWCCHDKGGLWRGTRRWWWSRGRQRLRRSAQIGLHNAAGRFAQFRRLVCTFSQICLRNITDVFGNVLDIWCRTSPGLGSQNPTNRDA